MADPVLNPQPRSPLSVAGTEWIQETWSFDSSDCWPGMNSSEPHLQSNGTCGFLEKPWTKLINCAPKKYIVINQIQVNGNGAMCVTFAEEDSDEDIFTAIIQTNSASASYEGGENMLKLGRGKDLILWRVINTQPTYPTNITITYQRVQELE